MNGKECDFSLVCSLFTSTRWNVIDEKRFVTNKFITNSD